MSRRAIDMQDLKALKRTKTVFFHRWIARDRPSRYGIRSSPRRKDLPVSMQYQKRPSPRRARACPSPCCLNKNSSIYGNGHLVRSGSGDPELQRAALYRLDREGQALALRERAISPMRSRGTGPRATGAGRHPMRSRGTGPRATGAGHLPDWIARDRPSRYGIRPLLSNN